MFSDVRPHLKRQMSHLKAKEKSFTNTRRRCRLASRSCANRIKQSTIIFSAAQRRRGGRQALSGPSGTLGRQAFGTVGLPAQRLRGAQTTPRKSASVELAPLDRGNSQDEAARSSAAGEGSGDKAASPTPANTVRACRAAGLAGGGGRPVGWRAALAGACGLARRRRRESADLRPGRWPVLMGGAASLSHLGAALCEGRMYSDGVGPRVPHLRQGPGGGLRGQATRGLLVG